MQQTRAQLLAELTGMTEETVALANDQATQVAEAQQQELSNLFG